MNEEYNFSFRCFFGSMRYNSHYQRLALCDVPKWIDCYRFTHPNCQSISMKIWFTEPPSGEWGTDDEDD